MVCIEVSSTCHLLELGRRVTASSAQSWAEEIRTEQGRKVKLVNPPFTRPDLADLLRPQLEYIVFFYLSWTVGCCGVISPSKAFEIVVLSSFQMKGWRIRGWSKSSGLSQPKTSNPQFSPSRKMLCSLDLTLCWMAWDKPDIFHPSYKSYASKE